MKMHAHFEYMLTTFVLLILVLWGSTDHDRSQDKRIDQQEKQIAILLEELQK